MAITNLKRHTPRPGAKTLGKSLPIVRYHELELDGPFVNAIITVVEDGLWKSNIIRLAIHTSAEIQEGLTGQDGLKILKEMFQRQKDNPEGKNAVLKSDITVSRPTPQKTRPFSKAERERPMAVNIPTGAFLPIIGCRQLARDNDSVTVAISVSDKGMWLTDVMTITKQEANRVQAGLANLRRDLGNDPGNKGTIIPTNREAGLSPHMEKDSANTPIPPIKLALRV